MVKHLSPAFYCYEGKSSYSTITNTLTCDCDIEAVEDRWGEDLIASSSYRLNPGLNCTCVSSCVTLLDIGDHDVSRSAGNKAHWSSPAGIKQDTISSPWVSDICSWMVGGIAGEGEGHVQLGWDGGQGRRGDHGGSCVSEVEEERGEVGKKGKGERRTVVCGDMLLMLVEIN